MHAALELVGAAAAARLDVAHEVGLVHEVADGVGRKGERDPPVVVTLFLPLRPARHPAERLTLAKDALRLEHLRVELRLPTPEGGVPSHDGLAVLRTAKRRDEAERGEHHD